MASVVAGVYNGVLGACCQWDTGAEPLVRGQSPPEVEAIFVFERSMEAAKFPTF